VAKGYKPLTGPAPQHGALFVRAANYLGASAGALEAVLNSKRSSMEPAEIRAMTAFIAELRGVGAACRAESTLGAPDSGRKAGSVVGVKTVVQGGSLVQNKDRALRSGCD
jgi:hypothetical protein